MICLRKKQNLGSIWTADCQDVIIWMDILRVMHARLQQMSLVNNNAITYSDSISYASCMKCRMLLDQMYDYYLYEKYKL